MNSLLFQKAEQFMIDAFTKAGDLKGIAHHQSVVKWVRFLEVNAGEALLVAATIHDIERAVYGDWKAGTMEFEKLRKHEEQSGAEAEKFLLAEGVKKELIEHIKSLIERHQEGGNKEQNLLCDADCLAYFENNSVRQARTFQEQGRTKENIKEILDFMLGKISSDKAKKIALPYYEEATRILSQ